MTRHFGMTLLTVIILSCNNGNKPLTDETKPSIRPFEIKISDSDYSMAYSIIYKLTEKELSIIFNGELEGEKDTVIFKKELLPSDTLLQLSNIDIKNLKEYYENPCIMDGSQIFVSIKKDSVEKSVQLSNYYEENIGKAIELINSLTPKEHEIWYDRKELLDGMKECDEQLDTTDNSNEK